MRALLALVLALSMPACAQWSEQFGIRYRHLAEETAGPGHSWMRWDRLFSNSAEGDNVTYYAQHYHTGRGPAFGIVVEVQRSLPGPSWGIEIDMMQPYGGPYQPALGIVVGGYQGKGRGHIRDGVLVTPWQGRQENGVVDYALRVDLRCLIACIDIPPGERIRLSPDPTVGALRFDPVTGILGMWRADGFLVWGIQQATGEEYRMRRF